jgi:hypothetical protein
LELAPILTSTQSNIDFNASKCKVLTISSRKSPIETKYHLCSTELVRVDSEVDLEITVTRKLSWNQHINQIVSKANKMLGLLRRTCPLLTNLRSGFSGWKGREKKSLTQLLVQQLSAPSPATRLTGSKKLRVFREKM